jgi:hypothetical protein
MEKLFAKIFDMFYVPATIKCLFKK